MCLHTLYVHVHVQYTQVYFSGIVRTSIMHFFCCLATNALIASYRIGGTNCKVAK